MSRIEKYSTFTDCGITYKFLFERCSNVDCIHIIVFEPEKGPGGSAWLHYIKNDGIVWRKDDALNITPKAKEFFNKAYKLKAFL